MENIPINFDNVLYMEIHKTTLDVFFVNSEHVVFENIDSYHDRISNTYASFMHWLEEKKMIYRKPPSY